MKHLYLTLALLALSGCASPSKDTPSHISFMAGVPVLAASYSSGTQITPDLALVTKHASSDNYRESSRYDAALIEMKGSAPTFAAPVLGEAVTVHGTGMFGQELVVKTRVIDTNIWACDGPYIPAIHTVPGICTARNMGYTYGFAVERNGIKQGFSGGGAYNATGDLVGIVIQVGTDTNGRDVAFLYAINDLREDLGLVRAVEARQ